MNQLHAAFCSCSSQTPSPPSVSLLGSHRSPLCLRVHFRVKDKFICGMSNSTCERSYGIRLSLSDRLHLVWSSLGPPGCCQGPHFILFYGHCEHVQHLLYPVIGGPPGFSMSWLWRTLLLRTLGCTDPSKLRFCLDISPGMGWLAHPAASFSGF